MGSIYMGRAFGAAGGGGGVQEFATTDALVVFHAETPLADGEVWHSLNPPLFGTVVDGNLTPDPLFSPTALTRSVTTTRRVIRGYSLSTIARTIPHTIEVV